MAFRRLPARSRIPSDDSDLTLSSVQNDINHLVVRIDDVILTDSCPSLERFINNHELFGFALQYKVPCAPRGNAQLNREVVFKSSSYDSSSIQFKHKKVYSVELDCDLMNTWDTAALQLELRMEVAKNSRIMSRANSKTEVLARTSISLRDILAPPFMISRDFDLIGRDFNGVVAISLELNSRKAKVAEKIEELRKSSLDDTFNVRNRPARHTRVRSRSVSRCRSCSPTQPRSPSPPAAAVRRQPRQVTRELYELSPLECSTAYRRTHPPIPVMPLRERQAMTSSASDESDSVFEVEPSRVRSHPEAVTRPFSRTSQGSYSSRGAVRLELTLHEARNLPFVKDQRFSRSGQLVSPRAFIQMLGRDEQVMSSVAAPSRNPNWNWSGRFIFSCERGNLLIKMLHSTEDGRFECIGMVTLNAPLHSFERTEFELTVLTPQSSGRATVSLSLTVSPLPRTHSAVELCMSRNSVATESIRSDEDDVLRWSGTRRNPQLILTTRRSRPNSRTRSPPMNNYEDTSHKLVDNLHQLENLMLPIRSLI